MAGHIEKSISIMLSMADKEIYKDYRCNNCKKKLFEYAKRPEKANIRIMCTRCKSINHV